MRAGAALGHSRLRCVATCRREDPWLAGKLIGSVLIGLDVVQILGARKAQ